MMMKKKKEKKKEKKRKKAETKKKTEQEEEKETTISDPNAWSALSRRCGKATPAPTRGARYGGLSFTRFLLFSSFILSPIIVCVAFCSRKAFST